MTISYFIEMWEGKGKGERFLLHFNTINEKETLIKPFIYIALK